MSAVRVALDVFAACAERGARALETGDSDDLGDAMNQAQRAYNDELAATLDELRAPLLRATCAELTEKGALGAKFSGAGGDGSVIALYATHDRAMEAVHWLEKNRVVASYVPVGSV